MAALKGVVNVRFPSVGATMQMTVCEDVGRGTHVCGKTLCTARETRKSIGKLWFLMSWALCCVNG
jgi:hypothetical protein